MDLSPADLGVTDAHAHFFSHRFFRTLLSSRPGRGPAADAEVAPAVEGLGLEPPPRDPAELARRWAAELDRHGVRQSVLIASVPGDWSSVAAAVKLFPDRFIGFTIANPRVAGACDELARAFDDGGLKGVCLFPAMHRFRIWDPPARDIIEIARDRRAIVFCHFGLLSVPVRDRLGVPNDFDGSCSVPTDLHGVAADYPDVVFQLPHFGCGYPRETFLLGAQRPNVVIDTSSSNSWIELLPYPLELGTLIKKALAVFGPERILWGSDSSVFPRGWRRDLFDLQVRLFREAGAGRKELEDIFGGNLRRILGMP